MFLSSKCAKCALVVFVECNPNTDFESVWNHDAGNVYAIEVIRIDELTLSRQFRVRGVTNRCERDCQRAVVDVPVGDAVFVEDVRDEKLSACNGLI